MDELVIYDEEIDFYETELAMERCLYESNLCDLLYCESANDKSQKNIIDKIIETFKKFIEKCRKYIKLAIDKITGRVQQAYTTHKLNDILKNFDTAIKNAEKSGMTKFEFVNIDALKKCIKEEADAYEKVIKKFSKMYIISGSPKEAEKMIDKVKTVEFKYKKMLHDIISNPKTYSINDAKHIAQTIKECKDSNNAFIQILDRHIKICNETEDLVIGVLKSLDKYSEDTGYIQNAKSLKEIIHNASITLQSHTAEVVTTILKTGVGIICNIDEFVHTKKHEIEENDGNIIKIKVDESSPQRKKTREYIDGVAETLGSVADAGVKTVRKVSRKNDIKNWKSSRGKELLSFDKRKLTEEEKIEAAKKTPITYATHTIAPKVIGKVARTASDAAIKKLNDYVKK